MSRLTELLTAEQKGKFLSVYLTAGFPEKESLETLVLTAEESGADFVEVGVPFSDPIADGPTIQAASYSALQNGITVKEILLQVEAVRQQSNIPMLLMSYLNPFIRYGLKEIVRDFEHAGGDGFIIPDLLPDEYHRFKHAFAESGIGPNFLVAPNTSQERIKAAAELSADFLYCVSTTGVTGARQGVPQGIQEFLALVRKQVSKPAFVGFGIASGADAAQIARLCDGVIVGSAVIKILQVPGSDRQNRAALKSFISELKEALKGA